MQPLTHQVWAKHFTELRPHILDEFPDVDRMELERVDDDWDGLVELVQNATRMSAEDVENRLRTLDVEELGLGTGATPVEGDGRASIEQIRLGAGFTEDDRPRIVERLRKLDRRLRRFPADATDLRLSVKDRESTSQQLTLEARLPGFPTIVATSNESDLRDALMDVREDLWRRVDEAVTRRNGGR